MKVMFTKAQVAAFEKHFGWCLGEMEKGRDISKLCPKVITDKNGRKMTVYVRCEEAPKKGGGGKGGGSGGGGSAKGFLFRSLKDKDKARLAKKINGTVVAQVRADSIPYNGDKDFREAARAWLARNPQGNAKTAIGDVDISWGAVKPDMGHNRKEGYMKLQTLPAVKDILEKGTYLGYEKDFDGKPIDNHYFAGKIKYGGAEKIVFCRVRKNAGMNNRFYVHEIFTEEEIKKDAAKPSDGKFSSLREKSLYHFILHDIFTAADRIAQRQQKEKETSKRVPRQRPARLTGNPPNLDFHRPRTSLPRYESDCKSGSAGSPIISGPVDNNSIRHLAGQVKKKDVKKSAKKWIWIDENGKIWVKKSVLEAWKQGLAD